MSKIEQLQAEGRMSNPIVEKRIAEFRENNKGLVNLEHFCDSLRHSLESALEEQRKEMVERVKNLYEATRDEAQNESVVCRNEVLEIIQSNQEEK